MNPTRRDFIKGALFSPFALSACGKAPETPEAQIDPTFDPKYMNPASTRLDMDFSTMKTLSGQADPARFKYVLFSLPFSIPQCADDLFNLSGTMSYLSDESRSRLQPVLIVPEFETADLSNIRTFQDQFPNGVIIGGPAKEMLALAQKYSIAYVNKNGLMGDNNFSDLPETHTRLAFLFDPQGHHRVTYKNPEYGPTINKPNIESEVSSDRPLVQTLEHAP